MKAEARKPRRHKFRLVALMLLVTGLLALNAGVASAHNWGSWHWDKSGSHIQIQSYIYGGTQAQAEAARVDAWNKVPILYNYRVNYHTDVSVFDGNFGATGWAGLASIESTAWDWGCFGWCHVTHAHARLNTYYPMSSWYQQGVYCQEVYHTYGFDHDNTGGCMGLGYYSGSSNVLDQHNADDFYNRYRFH
ncbi:MAG: hypothetical protein ABI873_13040 [Marmoricola sp.]